MIPDGQQPSADRRCTWGLYVILDAAISRLSLEAAAERVLAGGAKVIQLRDKAAQFEDLIDTGHRLREMTTAAGATLIVNDNPYLAHEIGADGVHLGQSDFPPYIAREVLGANGIIGISTHNKQQALAALYQPVDYIAVGPVFPTNSKQSSNKPVGIEHVRWVARHVQRPIVAIGGLTAQTIPEVIAAGAQNVAMIGEIMAAPDIEAKVRELVQLIAGSTAAEK